MTADGCEPHKILLDDGSVIDSPTHTSENSHIHDGRCVDCGAAPDGIHHPHCDSARKPDGSQILIDSMAYWDPETEADPREPESDYVFLVVDLGDEHDGDGVGHYDEYRALIAFDALEKAEEYVDNEDWTTFGIQAMQITSEVPRH